MTSPAPLRLPANVTGRQPKGTPDSLQAVRPVSVVAPMPMEAKVRAIGTHAIRIRKEMQTAAATIDGVEVLYVSDVDGREMHVLADTNYGIVEILGWTAEQHDFIRRTYFDGRGIKPATTSRPAPAKTTDVDRLLKLSESIDGNVDNGYLATRATLGDSEVDRLVALATTLDDGASPGDSEVDRLAKLGDSLSNG